MYGCNSRVIYFIGFTNATFTDIYVKLHVGR